MDRSAKAEASKEPEVQRAIVDSPCRISCEPKEYQLSALPQPTRNDNSTTKGLPHDRVMQMQRRDIEKYPRGLKLLLLANFAVRSTVAGLDT
jgi:hypothetical protein